MRVARLAHTLGFGIAPRLRERTREDAGLLGAAAAERVLSEVALTLAVGRTAAAACLWDHLGLLPWLFPEIAALRGIQQSDFHHLDAYHHTLETARQVDEIIAQPGRWFGGSWQPLEERLAMPVDGVLSRPVALRLAALLHDIGKATTKGVDAQGRIMFWGHTTEGARIVRGVNRRLKLSTKAGTLLRTVVGEHLSIGKLERDGGDSSRGAVRYLWQTAPWAPEVIVVSTADRLATQGPLTGRGRMLAQLALASRLMARWWERERDGVPRPPLDGDGLQAALGLSPGPLLGEVLQEVRWPPRPARSRRPSRRSRSRVRTSRPARGRRRGPTRRVDRGPPPPTRAPRPGCGTGSGGVSRGRRVLRRGIIPSPHRGRRSPAIDAPSLLRRHQ